jgi:hypothetical protein
MFSLSGTGKSLILLGIIFILLGLVCSFAGKIPHLGRLPGDIEIHTKNAHFYFPLATSLIISLVLTVMINLILRNK